MKHTASIKKSGDFAYVYKNGRHYPGRYLVLYALRRGQDDAGRTAEDSGGAGKPGGGTRARVVGAGGTAEGYSLLGVSASKKVGGSVRRNRMRRLVKENYRLMEECVRGGFFYIFVVRAQNAEAPGFSEIRRDMRGLFSRAGVFDWQRWEVLRNGV